MTKFNYAPTDILAGIPAESWVPSPVANVHFLEADKNAIEARSGLELVQAERFLALTRKDPWFLHPVWGRTESDIPETECQLLIWRRRDGLWAVLITTAHGNRRAWLQKKDGRLSLAVRGVPHSSEPERLCLAVLGLGEEPSGLITEVIHTGMRRLGTARPRINKPAPAWVEWFGWCTWDAFYQQVTEQKVQDGLAAFQQDGLPIPLLILDDGWQQWNNAQLLSFPADPTKFPHGLAGFGRSVKAQFGVRIFGVWHALTGYWNGVHPHGELAQRYRLCPSFHGAYNVPKGKDLHRSLVHPEDVHRFYQDFHSYLRSEGVDLVKIDNQASLDHFTENIFPDGLVMAEYQKALQGSSAVHFGNNLLHCMAMSNDIAWHLSNSAVWRNSQDYFPRKPESHGYHLVANAANALWSSAFALPDWDMFHSGGASGWFHGAARAISGGPVYISDAPGNHDAKLIRALTVSAGRIPRLSNPAQVAASRLLVDCATEPRLLLVRNVTAAGFLLGVFHCRYTAVNESITDTWSPSDAHAEGRVAVYGFRSGKCEVMDATEVRSLTLDSLGWEILTIVPVVYNMAPLGLEGKLAGAAAITRCIYCGEDRVQLELLDGGDFMAWSGQPLAAEDAAGQILIVHDKGDGLFVIKIPVGGPAFITIRKIEEISP